MEDLYSGIEWKAGSADAERVLAFLNGEMGQSIASDSGIGIKPISVRHTKIS